MDGSDHDSALTAMVSNGVDIEGAARALELLSENNLETLSVTLLRISDNDAISTQRLTMPSTFVLNIGSGKNQ